MSLALEEENPDLAEELSEIDSLASDNEDYENTSDDEFVPPPPPPEESLEKDETDDEYNEDNNSLPSESSDIQVDNAQETPVYLNNESEDEDDDYDNDDDDDDNYLQKFEHLK